MKIVNSEDNILAFLNYVSAQKRNFTEWQFLHLSISDGERSLQIDEVVQFLEFQVQSDKGILLNMQSGNELLFFTHKDDSLIVSKFEKSVYENFPSNSLRCLLKTFDNDGLEKFSKIVEAYIDKSSLQSVISFKRMRRNGNCLLVLDDDAMVLKQLEKVLTGIGNVVTVQDADDFQEAYEQYAPNVLFLDVHLRTAKGNQILKALKRDVDPSAHVVMISSDTQKDLILDIKQGGANGFVVKPFDRTKLYKEVLKAPTILKKSV